MEEITSALMSWDPQENTSLLGHSGPIWAVKPTQDESVLFSGSEDKSVIIWDLKTQQTIGTLLGHNNTVNTIELCQNEEVLVSGDWDGIITIWDWRQQISLDNLQGHTAGVYIFAIDKSTTKLISGSGDYTARIWDVPNRTCLATLSNNTNSVFSLALTPNEKFLVTGGWNGILKIWDFEDFKQVSTHQCSTEAIQCMGVTFDSKYLIFGTRGNKVKVWTWEDKKEVFSFDAHNNWIRNLVISQDSKFFFSASADKTIRMVNIESKTEEFNFTLNDGYIFALALGSKGTNLYSGASDNIIRVRKIGRTRKVVTLSGHTRCIMSIAISKSLQFLVTGSEDTSVRKWCLETYTQLFSTNFHGSTVWAVAITENSQFILTVGGDHKLNIMSADGNLLRSLPGHKNPAFCVSAALNNKICASGAQDKMVILWSIREQSLIKVLEGHTDTVFSVKFCENDSKLLSSSADYTIRIWCTCKLNAIAVVKSPGGMIESVALSPDLKYLAVGDRKNQIHIWDWSSLNYVKGFFLHSKWVKSVAFSADSKTLASSSNDWTIKMWDMEDLCLDYTIAGHENTVRSVVFSWDNQFLASASEDSKAKLWYFEDDDKLGIVDFVGVYDDFLLKSYLKNSKLPSENLMKYSFNRLKVNVLHVYCYLGCCELLGLALEAGVPVKRDRNMRSPLFYALLKNQTSCIDLFLEHILNDYYEKKKEINDCYMFITHDFPLLLRCSSKVLPVYLNELFPVNNQSSISWSAYNTEKLPIYRYTNSEKIEMKLFGIKENQDINKPMEFRSSKFKVDLRAGSEESMMILNSLYHNHLRSVLDSEIVKAILNIKLNEYRKIFTAQFLLSFVCCITATFKTMLYLNYFLLIGPIIIIYKLRQIKDLFLFSLVFLIESSDIKIGLSFGLFFYLTCNFIIRNSCYKLLGICLKKSMKRVSCLMCLAKAFTLVSIQYSEKVFVWESSKNIFNGGLGYFYIAVFFVFCFLLVLELIQVLIDKSLRNEYWVSAFHRNIKEIIRIETHFKGKLADKNRAYIHSCGHLGKINDRREKYVLKINKDLGKLVKINEEKTENLGNSLNSIKIKLEEISRKIK